MWLMDTAWDIINFSVELGQAFIFALTGAAILGNRIGFLYNSVRTELPVVGVNMTRTSIGAY